MSFILDKIDMSNERHLLLYDLCEEEGFIRYPNILKTDDAGSVQLKLYNEFVGHVDLRAAGFSCVPFGSQLISMELN